MNYDWIEPFAGGLSVGLRLVGGRHLVPPCSWMGGKRRLAPHILAAMGVPCERPARVLLADAGPWGWVWPQLLDLEGSAEVSKVLRRWEGEDPRKLWVRLAACPPHEDPAERAAQWLWLQARSASGVPLWWDGWRDGGDVWKADTGGGKAGQKGDNSSAPSMLKRKGWRIMDHDTGRHHGAGQASGRPAGWRMAEEPSKARRGDRTVSQTGGGWQQPSGAGGLKSAGQSRPNHPSRPDGDAQIRLTGGGGQARGVGMAASGGIVHPATIADRIDAIAYAFRRVAVVTHHGDGAELLDHALEGTAFCFADPPYHLPKNCTGYGWDMDHGRVVEMARAFETRGAVVAISEGAPVTDLEGWHALELTAQGNGKPEWLTTSRAPVRVPAVQQALLVPVERPLL